MRCQSPLPPSHCLFESSVEEHRAQYVTLADAAIDTELHRFSQETVLTFIKQLEQTYITVIYALFSERPEEHIMLNSVKSFP